MPVRARVHQRRFPSLAAEALVSLVVAAEHFTQAADAVARITKAGLKLLATIDPEVDALMQSVTRPLSQAQLRELARLCDALVP